VRGQGEAFAQGVREVILQADQFVVQLPDTGEGQLLVARRHRAFDELLMRGGTDLDQLIDQQIGIGPNLHRALDEGHLPIAQEEVYEIRHVGRVVLALQKIDRRAVTIGRDLLQRPACEPVTGRHADIAEEAHVVRLVAVLEVTLQVEDGVFLILGVEALAGDVGAQAGENVDGGHDDQGEGDDHGEGQQVYENEFAPDARRIEPSSQRRRVSPQYCLPERHRAEAKRLSR
jgi:hypothetical protein